MSDQSHKLLAPCWEYAGPGHQHSGVPRPDCLQCFSQEEKELPETAQAAASGFSEGAGASKAAAANEHGPLAAPSPAPAAAVPAVLQNGAVALPKEQPANGRPHVAALTDAQLSALLIANGVSPAAAEAAVEKCVGAKSGKQEDSKSRLAAAVAATIENVRTANKWLPLASAAIAATDPANRAKLGGSPFHAIYNTCTAKRHPDSPIWACSITLHVAQHVVKVMHKTQSERLAHESLIGDHDINRLHDRRWAGGPGAIGSGVRKPAADRRAWRVFRGTVFAGDADAWVDGVRALGGRARAAAVAGAHARGEGAP